MAELPTITVTPEQQARVIAAFSTVEQYKKWLRQSIIDYVSKYEIAQEDANYVSQRETRLEEIVASLDGTTPATAPPPPTGMTSQEVPDPVRN